jgi:hypothetical protein
MRLLMSIRGKPVGRRGSCTVHFHTFTLWVSTFSVSFSFSVAFPFSFSFAFSLGFSLSVYSQTSIKTSSVSSVQVGMRRRGKMMS